MEEKDSFFRSLQKEVNECTPTVLGDLNGRIGCEHEKWHGTLGRCRENFVNNGERILNFSVEIDLKILNTLFPHKEEHRYTREEPGRNERSVIDYVLVKREVLGPVGCQAQKRK